MSRRFADLFVAPCIDDLSTTVSNTTATGQTWEKVSAHLHFGGFFGVAVEALRLDGFEALGFLFMSKQQAAHLGHPLPPLFCLLHCQCLHTFPLHHLYAV